MKIIVKMKIKKMKMQALAHNNNNNNGDDERRKMAMKMKKRDRRQARENNETARRARAHRRVAQLALKMAPRTCAGARTVPLIISSLATSASLRARAHAAPSFAPLHHARAARAALALAMKSSSATMKMALHDENKCNTVQTDEQT